MNAFSSLATLFSPLRPRRYTICVSTKRLFIAVHLTDSLRTRIGRIQESLSPHAAAVRPVSPRNLHLTLHFLGETEEEHIPAVQAALHRSLTPYVPFRTTVGGGGCFPSPRKPRVFWVGVAGKHGPLADIHGSLYQELSALGFELDRREFTPHITIAHARKRAERSALTHAVGDLAAAAESELGSSGSPLPVGEVSLVESVLGRGGPRYSDLERAGL